jgi:hypothetical protein
VRLRARSETLPLSNRNALQINATIHDVQNAIDRFRRAQKEVLSGQRVLYLQQ